MSDAVGNILILFQVPSAWFDGWRHTLSSYIFMPLEKGVFGAMGGWVSVCYTDQAGW